MSQNVLNNKDRMPGLDLLRMLSMVYVVILHVFSHGGLLDAASAGTPQYYFSTFLENVAFVAVDIFALITGYCINTQKTPKGYFVNLLTLWFEVLFYGIIILALISALHPEMVTREHIYAAFFPIIKKEYWYFTAYVGAVFFMPIIGTFIEISGEGLLKKLFVLLFIVFSVLDIFVSRWIPSDGYSFVWLMLLFLFGAILRKCRLGENIKGRYLFIGIIALCFFHWGWRNFGPISISIIGIEITRNTFSSYVSPLVLGSSVLYLMLFSKIGGVPSTAKKVITILSPGTFAAYLINDNRLTRKLLVTDKFYYLADKNVGTIAIIVIGFAVVFVIMSSFIDIVRQKLFKTRVKEISERIVNGIDRMIG